MAKKTYSEKLRDPRWQKLRLQVLERDNFTCINCGDIENTLHVHHKYYQNIDPWDTDIIHLVTLCEDCHKIEEEYLKTNPAYFIDLFKQSEFFAEDLTNLVWGMHLCKLQMHHRLVADAYEFAFTDADMQALILKKFFANCKKKLKTMPKFDLSDADF